MNNYEALCEFETALCEFLGVESMGDVLRTVVGLVLLAESLECSFCGTPYVDSNGQECGAAPVTIGYHKWSER